MPTITAIGHWLSGPPQLNKAAMLDSGFPSPLKPARTATALASQ
jgi:hypothetical protein